MPPFWSIICMASFLDNFLSSLEGYGLPAFPKKQPPFTERSLRSAMRLGQGPMRFDKPTCDVLSSLGDPTHQISGRFFRVDGSGCFVFA